MAGTDTPETTHPTVGVQPFGPDARLVRYVMRPGGEHVNATLIREGCATVIRTCSYARWRECLQLEAQPRRSRIPAGCVGSPTVL